MSTIQSQPFRQSRVPHEDRVDILDTLRRFAGGQDHRDLALLTSAFAPAATLDFSHPAGRLGIDLAAFNGRDEIVAAVYGSTAPLDTTHTVTNERITRYTTASATVEALIEAQHVLKANPDRRLLLKNALTVEVDRVEGDWLISSMIFRNVWREGEADVLFAG